ncbi:hypothetical protein [Desulfitobacterium chlororespirans]|uniref:Uncharacterized protein n=1 Tax=Desulfitobacterium chlororespirans DSM 11544 TaxID=1121395 RepID=A0A1M7UPK2_9FIRM|nr:hypothetical protein [Desulfitobacterium chlororespirans]SHN84827.1 hypothetical protein SAMN02745215_04288 [Desulfitobacterium chlororespirans DSM 11544]
MKKVVCMFLIVFMTAFSVIPVYAMRGENLKEQSIVTPLYTYIYAIVPGLSIDSSGRSTSFGAASTYSSSHTITVNVELQKLSGNSWIKIKDWSVSGPGVPGVETINDYYVTRGTYRVCVTVKVYDASNKLLETQSEYSAVKIY